MLLDLWPAAAGARSHRRSGTGTVAYTATGAAAVGAQRAGTGVLAYAAAGPGAARPEIRPPVPLLLVPSELLEGARLWRRRGAGIVGYAAAGPARTEPDPILAALARRHADDDLLLLLTT